MTRSELQKRFPETKIEPWYRSGLKAQYDHNGIGQKLIYINHEIYIDHEMDKDNSYAYEYSYECTVGCELVPANWYLDSEFPGLYDTSKCLMIQQINHLRGDDMIFGERIVISIQEK